MNKKHRRRAIKGLMLSLPAVWTKPIVNSIVLPAHAQTSADSGPEPVTYSISCDEITAEQRDDITTLVAVTVTGTVTATGGGDVENIPILANFQLTSPLLDAGTSVGIVTDASGNFSHFRNISFTTQTNASVTVSFDNSTVDYGADSSTCQTPITLLSNCLLHGTQILMPDGKTRNIEDLVVGEAVAALDETSQRMQPAVVTRIVTDHRRDHYWCVNGAMRITNDHPVMVKSGPGASWLRVDALTTGTLIKSLKGWTPVSSLKRVQAEAETVYMETTAGNFVVAAGGADYVVKANYGKLSERRGRKRSTTVAAG